MQSYDPTQPHDGYYQQQPQNQQRISLPPASSFFDTGHQPPPGYHHSNTPQSEPPPSPFLTGHYNQPQSYPSTDPNTPYMHSSVISPPAYNMGAPPHFPPMQPIYDQPQSMEHSGYGGMEQHPRHLQQQPPPPPPQHHPMSMGYPATSMMPQDHTMQMGYMSPMDQGLMNNYSQHQGFSHMPPPQPQIMHPPMMQLPPRSHHSDETPTSVGHHPNMLPNNSMLRNQLRQQPSTMQEPPPTPQSTMESIAPPENMSQVLQMQQPPQPQLQNSSQQQRREDASLQSSNYISQPLMNREVEPREYNGSAAFQRQHSQPQPVYSNHMEEPSYGQGRGPPQMPQQTYHQPHGPIQIQQNYHQPSPHPPETQSFQQHVDSHIPDFSKITEPPIVSSPAAETSECSAESSIAATVAEVIAKQTARKATPPASRKRRHVRSFEAVVESIVGDSDPGPTVKQHLQAQQHEKKIQEQEKRLTKVKDNKNMQKVMAEEEEKNIFESPVSTPPTTAAATEILKGPSMTRTEFLQAHRQRKSDSQQSEIERKEKDTVTRIIEEIAGKHFQRENQTPEFIAPDNLGQTTESQHMVDDEKLPGNSSVPGDAEKNSEVSATPPPKPKRIRKRVTRETKAQKESKKKFLFKCCHLQRTIRSLILKNSALADETSRLFYRIKNVTEERKLLAKRLQHYERNRIRRIQTQKKKKARAEAQLASTEQSFLQQIQEPEYPASVEIIEAPEFSEQVEAYPFENMMHKEMAVYMPPLNEDYSQIPYLDNGNCHFEGFQEEPNDGNLFPSVYNMHPNFNNFQPPQNFSNTYEEAPSNYQKFQSHSEPIQYFDVEDDAPPHFFDQPIPCSETSMFTPDSRPHSGLSGQINQQQ